MRARLVSGWMLTALIACVAGEVQSVSRDSWWLWPGEVMALAVIVAVLVLWPVRDDWRKRRGYVIGSVTVLVLILIHLLAGPVYYRSPAIAARVIDAESGQPIAGATVRAEWRLRATATLEESREAGTLHAATAIAGADGSFLLPAWRAKLRPPLRWLAREDPRLTITTPDGRRVNVDNGTIVVRTNGGHVLLLPRHNPFSSARPSSWSGFDIPIQR